MKKLLATSAIAMIAMSGAAFAQAANTGTDADFTVVDDNANVNAGPSLLSRILTTATDVQISMTNAAENLANLDGSINVLESANVDELLAELSASVSFDGGQGDLYTWEVDGVVDQGTLADYQAAINAIASNVELISVTPGVEEAPDTYTWEVDGVEASGTLAQYNAAVAAAANNTDVVLYSVVSGDLFEGLIRGVSRTVDGTTAIDFFDPALTVDALQTSVGNLSTTVIGALNTGVIGSNGGVGGSITANTLNMANMELESLAQTSASLARSANYFQPGDLQLANLATNMATVVDASVNVDQLMANVSGVSTTLIGALNTGDIATNVNQNASNLTTALVGQQ